jgi:hypothetical protein
MRSLLTILAGACCASLALAQPPGTTRTESRSTTTTAGFHRISTVVGTAFTLGTESVGKVVDVVFDEGGCISYVLVQDPDGFIVVPWGVVTVNYDQKIVTVNSTTVTRDRLREVTFTEGRLPNFSDASFTQKMTTVWGAGAGRSGRSGAGTSPDRKGGTTPPDRTSPGTTTPDRKGGTTPPDRTTPPGTTTPRPKDEPPAKDTPRTPPKKDKDKDGKDGR